MDEVSRVDASDIEDVLLGWLKELTLVESYLKEAPFEEFCGDIVIGSATPSIVYIDPICTKPLKSTSISFPLFPTTPSYVHAFHESLGDIKGSHPSFDPHYTYVYDMPRKIMWSPFFDNGFDLSMALGRFKRPLTFLTSSFVLFSFLHNFKKYVFTFDKLLKALTTSKLSGRLLSDVAESVMLLEPLSPPLFHVFLISLCYSC